MPAASLTVVSWNVLADAYVRPAFFPYTTPAILDAQTRLPALLDRLVRHTTSGADVLCLQEIEPEVFAAITKRLDGFDGSFAQKRDKPDGCAIFVRRALGAASFRELVFGDGSGHVAVAAFVAGVAIASTHLKWQAATVPLDERLGRLELQELLDAWLLPGERWIVCGDLNAEASSPVLEVAFARGMRDAYASFPDACTANANARRKRIDFILHTPDLEATPSSIPPITDTTPLPSEGEPSDHLAIRAVLRRLDR